MTSLKASPAETGDDAVERDRKAEHIELALDERMQVRRNFFDLYHFEHEALPEITMDEVVTATRFVGRDIAAPLLISCMTGGTDEATRINKNLAIAAEATGIALGVGSQRKAIEDPSLAASFEVRRYAPSIPVLANLGAVQLNYGFGVDECRAAVEMIGADGLVFHLNPLQEAIQPEGQCDFSGLIAKMAAVAERLEVPIIAKEVGSGISASTAQALLAAGIGIIDCAGVGGTSWARIEAARARDLEIGEVFADWGIATPENVRALSAVEGIEIIASGGVRNGLDTAKAIAFGADLVGMAQPFLRAGVEAADRVVEKAESTIRELRIAMFCTGSRDLDALAKVELPRRIER